VGGKGNSLGNNFVEVRFLHSRQPGIGEMVDTPPRVSYKLKTKARI